MAASKQASIFSRESGRITYLERENSAKVGLEPPLEGRVKLHVARLVTCWVRAA